MGGCLAMPTRPADHICFSRGPGPKSTTVGQNTLAQDQGSKTKIHWPKSLVQQFNTKPHINNYTWNRVSRQEDTCFRGLGEGSLFAFAQMLRRRPGDTSMTCHLQNGLRIERQDVAGSDWPATTLSSPPLAKFPCDDDVDCDVVTSPDDVLEWQEAGKTTPVVLFLTPDLLRTEFPLGAQFVTVAFLLLQLYKPP